MTWGTRCSVPVGLALYSRAAPRSIGGLMIGVYYLHLFLANMAVGRLGGFLETLGGTSFWLLHAGLWPTAAPSCWSSRWRSAMSSRPLGNRPGTETGISIELAVTDFVRALRMVETSEGVAMPTMCGELKEFESPVGEASPLRMSGSIQGGTEVARRSFWTKHRMVFPRIRIGEQTLEKAFVASDGLGQEIAAGARIGERVCLTVYGHLLTRKVIIGLRSESGARFVMPPSGLTSGLFWYGVFSPLVLSHPRGGSGDDRRDARRQAGNRPGAFVRRPLCSGDELVQRLPAHGR